MLLELLIAVLLVIIIYRLIDMTCQSNKLEQLEQLDEPIYYKQENIIWQGNSVPYKCVNRISRDRITYYNIGGVCKCTSTGLSSPVMKLPYENNNVKIIGKSFTLIPGSMKVFILLKLYKNDNSLTFTTNAWRIPGKYGSEFSITPPETLPIEFRPNKVKFLHFGDNGMTVRRNMNGTLTFIGIENKTYDNFVFDNFKI